MEELQGLSPMSWHLESVQGGVGGVKAAHASEPRPWVGVQRYRGTEHAEQAVMTLVVQNRWFPENLKFLQILGRRSSPTRKPETSSIAFYALSEPPVLKTVISQPVELLTPHRRDFSGPATLPPSSLCTGAHGRTPCNCIYLKKWVDGRRVHVKPQNFTCLALTTHASS